MRTYISLVMALLLTTSCTKTTSDSEAKVTIPFINTKSTLEIETGLVMRNGDVKPLANEEIFLLSGNLEAIMDSAGVTFEKDKASSHAESIAWSNEYGGIEPYISYMASARPVLESNTVYKFKTDLQGKASIEVEQGDYFLFAVSGVGVKTGIVWNYPISITEASTKITLTQDEAAWAY